MSNDEVKARPDEEISSQISSQEIAAESYGTKDFKAAQESPESASIAGENVMFFDISDTLKTTILEVIKSKVSKEFTESVLTAAASVSIAGAASLSQTLDPSPTQSLLQVSSSTLSSIAQSQPTRGATLQVNQSTSLSVLSSIILEILKLVFGHVPYFIFRILSTTLSFTVTLDFWGFMYLSTTLIILAVIYYRYRILNSFSNTLGGPPIQKNAFDLKPDISIDEASRQAYPDDFMNAFLSSIKVFGYLDRPVFHELAKNLTTRKLKAGEILFQGDSPDLDFYVVVDGKVQVFIKTNDADSDDDVADEGVNSTKDWAGHHLLNEVRNGGTVSSLFSILSILSENLELPLPLMKKDTSKVDKENSKSDKENDPKHQHQNLKVEIPSSKGTSTSSEKSSGPGTAGSQTGDTTPSAAKSSVPFTMEAEQFKKSLENLQKNLDSSLVMEEREEDEAKAGHVKEKVRSVHPNLVARAATSTTLAVIPASSFRNLSEKFPKAASHMASVILTRFHRVTFLTLQRYLGLSYELLDIEKKLIEVAGSGLPPDMFPPGLIESCAWRLSHQTLDSPTKDDPFASPRDSQASPLFSPRSPSGTHRAVFRMSPGTFDDDEDDLQFVSGDLDNRLCDSVFTAITQLIGLSNHSDSPSQGASGDERLSTPSSQVGSSIERFYYATRGGGGSNYTPSVNSKRNSLYFDDDIKSTTSSFADSINEEFSSSMEQEEGPEVKLLFFKQGKTILAEGERCPGLYFVLDGTLEASTGGKKTTANTSGFVPFQSTKKKSFLIQPGGLAGYLGAFTGKPSFINITAKTDVLVGLMPKIVLDRYVEKYPNVLLCLAKRLVQQLSPIVFHIDVALEWGQMNAGQVLCRQGEPSHSIFIVITGRLRSIKEKTYVGSSKESSLEIQGEYGPEESVGELEVLIDAPRASTVHAIRDSEIVIMPKTLFHALALRHPEIMITISRMIASRSSKPKKAFLSGNNLNMRTVALLPVSSDIPILEFAQKLQDSLRDMGANPAFIQTRNIMKHLGKHAFTRLGRLKLLSWLNDREEMHRIVLYVADGNVNAPWTQRCIRQADCILLVGLQDGDPSIGEYEQLLLSMKTTARKELVLLNSKRNCTPGSTAAWLKARLWIHAHHHIQMTLPSTGLSFEHLQQKHKQMTLGNLGAHFQKIYNSQLGLRYPTSEGTSPKVFTGIRSDFSRLSRRLLSKSIGLVLGGGGARGIAHLGALRALEEAGIPIDMVGGTSIGAFVGGLYARENDRVSVFGRVKSFATEVSSTWRTLLDLTYPFISMTSGNEFNRAIWKSFGDTQIEDCWLPYYCVTTNITFSREEIHTSGYIWRYIRASMSLAGWLPPICDNGTMLMDGGYLNNLPADVMLNMGAQTIIAIDVGGVYSTEPVTYGDSVSGWWILLNKINPFGKNFGQIPKLGEIQGRLAYATSVLKLEDTVKIEGIHYVAPPILEYGVLEFTKFAEIEQVGYDHMKKSINKWNEEGILYEQFGIRLEIKGRRASI